ncbi:MAG TPA: ABC transporter, partial [Ruminococcus sp.]|nr:ABC transporter [Ruminococcus sp.]
IGENGAGKSTTIKSMLGMIRPDSGTIKLLGEEISVNTSALKNEIGSVPDEIGLPQNLTAAKIGRIMAGSFSNWNSSTFSDYIKKFDLPLNQKFSTFSKGMKMKLGIAIALSHNAKLLILDEPTSGLDPLVRDEILDILNDFTRDETHSILISSHIVSDLEKICDYIAFLHKGKLMLCEEKDRLLEQYGILMTSEEDLNALDPNAIKGRKRSKYGVEAIVDKELIPQNFEVQKITIEELFVFMAKENDI